LAWGVRKGFEGRVTERAREVKKRLPPEKTKEKVGVCAPKWGGEGVSRSKLRYAREKLQEWSGGETGACAWKKVVEGRKKAGYSCSGFASRKECKLGKGVRFCA